MSAELHVFLPRGAVPDDDLVYDADRLIDEFRTHME
jgi:hypothetical protein